MPKYYRYRIADHYLYFTSHCIVEAMHVHASDKALSEAGSAKFFVRDDGSSALQNREDLTDKEINIIQKFIQVNFMDMYKTWQSFGGGDFYQK